MRDTTIINSVAPTRICDIGGWTDTWFAKSGSILNIAVCPYVEVQVKVSPKTLDREKLTVNLENYGDTFMLSQKNAEYGKHPLIEAAIDSVDLPKDMSCDINIFSTMPPGASTGTSGSITVALIGALTTLAKLYPSVAEVARLAHEVETVKLKRQSGIQDQLAAAFGGINYIEMREYPYATVSPLRLQDSVLWELERRLLLVYIGAPHDSSAIHEIVIERLGSGAANSPYLTELRKLASYAKTCLSEGDFQKFGDCMSQNTNIQREMHPGLVCQKFEDIIEICKAYNANGYKVNGAGGDGGTITILTDGDMNKKRIFMSELNAKGFEIIPVYLSAHGLRVWSEKG